MFTTNSRCNFSVHGDVTYTAQFKASECWVYCSRTPSEGGHVEGGGMYYYGDECTVTARAITGYEFLRWEIRDAWDNSILISTSTTNPYTFTVTDHCTLYKAIFQKKTDPLVVELTTYTPGVVKIGDIYRFNVSIASDVGWTLEHIDYCLSKDGSTFTTLNSNAPLEGDKRMSYIRVASTPTSNAMQAKVKVTFRKDARDTIVESNVVNVHERFPTAAEIRRNVEGNSRWAEQVAYVTGNKGSLREFGFALNAFAILNNNEVDAIDYRCEMAEGPICSCSATVVPIVITTANPNLGVQHGVGAIVDTRQGVTVATYHTHPPLTHCTGSNCIDPGPSTIDRTNANSEGIPGFVEHYIQKVCAGDAINLPKTTTNYGPSQRAAY